MTVLENNHLTVRLSEAMREGSKVEHQNAEGSEFMAELVQARVNGAGYVAYLLRLRRIYAALESVAHRHLTDPAVAAVHDPALERLAAIDADLDVWAPGIPRSVDSPAAAAYERRILDSAAWGGLFVAHHYTRYLGDLSGGQVIGRVLRREFGLTDGGTSFYEFPDIPKPKPYKDAYRARLDALGLDAVEQARVVDEVKEAFRLNQAIFEELGGNIAAYRR